MTITDTAAAKQPPNTHEQKAMAGSARELLLSGLPVTERRLHLAGISTAVLEGGDGPPIILLHGPGEYAAKWLRILPELVKTHRVIAPDLPGHGATEAVGPIDRDRVLAWLDELITRTCKTPPILVGQIIGGAIALRFAAAHGERLRGLILSDTLGLASFQPAPEFAEALAAFVTEPSPENHDRLWQRCAFDLDALRDGMGRSWDYLRTYNLDRAQLADLKPTQQSLFEQFALPATPQEELERVQIPTFLIWGRHDLATPLQIAEAASTRFGWPLHVIDGAADDPPIEQPAAFMKVLRTVLAERTVIESASIAREAWNRIAPGYDRYITPSHFWLAQEGLRRAGLRPGMRFLDVAAGSGGLSIPAARLGADVVATDISPAMIEKLRARAAGEGLAIEARVMDGHALELADESFDMAGSQFGVMLFPDMPRGIREMVRVVRPGGRVLLTAFGDPRRIDFLAFFIEAIKAVRPAFAGLPADPPPLPFQLRDPERLRFELETAGLQDVRVESTTERLEFTAGEQLWQWLTQSNPIPGAVLAGLELSEEERGKIRQALDRLVAARAKADGTAVLTSPINIGIGTKR
ncbi:MULTISPECIES: alpha/beta fold hydrolase [Chelativorans]|uniref:Methyltransferase type 11 n=1 Tax=Chelativorans sp. (strain BNC1) TaxID=266779 RepID=Q11FI3_CHESB|nr:MULTISPECIES: alpha/beta fold hydrolase [Chelativorans]